MSQFKQYDPISSIFINGVIIPPVPAVRDLGTILDSHLKLNAHVNNIYKTAHYAIRSIIRIQKYVTRGLRKAYPWLCHLSTRLLQ